MAVISLALLIASSAACESATSGGRCCGWLVSASGGGCRERDGGDKGGNAACEGVHTVVSLRFLIIDGGT